MGKTENLNFRLWLSCAAALPLLCVGLAVIFEYSGFDVWAVSHFYDFTAHSWPFRGHWLFYTVIHEWGRYLDIAAGGCWVILFACSFVSARLKPYRKLMLYFITAAAAGPLIVGVLKHMTRIYTPWELKIFSGTMPHIRIFDSVPPGLPAGEAFPAGHASGGYAFLALYFVLLRLGSPYRGYGLAAGLCLGLVFGIGQQIRGAHFPSHDLFTFAICWSCALVTYFVFYPDEWRLFK